jgi:hypothetical protein
MPGTAAAETKTVPCGSTVTASPEDSIQGTLLGLPAVDLGPVGAVSTTLTGTANALLGTVCKVTVNVVDAVVSPLPGVGAPAASAINGAAGNATNQLSSALAGNKGQQPNQQQPGPGSPGNPQSPPGSAPAGGAPAGASGILDASSPVLGGLSSSPNFGGLTFNFSTGYAPMRDYSNIPMVNAGLYSPSPGVRYGDQLPGYAPQFGILGQNGTKSGNSGIQNAGRAEALPGGRGISDGVGMPVLIAVLLLSGVSAGLVRTWVLRRMTTTA